LRLYGEQIAPQNYRLTPYELWDSKIKVNDWTLRTRPLCHIVKSIGYRLELSHQSLVYSGDTGYCEEVVELARGADLLILECSFPESVPGHLTPLEAGRIAQEAGSRRLVLVHLYPVCVADEIHKECQRHFSGQVTVASDLLRITI
jgi:ribonuclease BN (tRNA processing enzyme)